MKEIGSEFNSMISLAKLQMAREMNEGSLAQPKAALQCRHEGDAGGEGSI